LSYKGIPSFSPEIFAYIRNPDTSKYKAFSKGIDQLLAEGAVQALRQRNDDGGGPLILAAVGQLQFEVVQARLKSGKSALVLFHLMNASVQYKFHIRVLHLVCMYLHLIVFASCMH